MKAYEWKPIEDLPADWTKLASSELAGLASVWREHYETVKDGKALKQFNERLRREWAIETGIIENLYYIDRGVTLTLIEKGIEASLIPHGSTDRPAELIVPILKDQEEVVTGLFDFVGQKRQLSTSYIKQLHQALTQHQRTTAARDSFGQDVEVELLRGDWKKLPNNPTKSDGSIHEYCPPEQVASEMDQLIAWHQEHLEKQVPPELEAAWLHHRFTQIHPFQDGNGRMARTLASLIFLRAGLFPLVVHLEDRDEYLDILLQADFSDLKPFVQFISRAQKRAINQALSLSENILLENAPIEQVIAAAAKQLKTKRQGISSSFLVVETLVEKTKEKLSELSPKLNQQLNIIDRQYKASLSFSNQSSHHNLDPQIANLSNKMGYFADTQRFSKFVSLTIVEEHQAVISFSFHALGKGSTGVYAALAFIQYYPLQSGAVSDPFPLSQEIFQFAENEPEKAVIERFNSWLDEVTLNGLNHGRQQL